MTPPRGTMAQPLNNTRIHAATCLTEVKKSQRVCVWEDVAHGGDGRTEKRQKKVVVMGMMG